MNFKIATSWSELNSYQKQNVAHLLFTEPNKDYKFAIKLLRAVVVASKSWWQKMKFHWLILCVPFSTLLPYIDFVQEEPDLYQFPQIKGLKAPSNRIGSFTIKQFSIVDYLFYQWKKTNNQLFLRQMVAAIYTLGEFNEDNLPKIAETTDKLSDQKRAHVAFAFMCSRNYIVKNYPVVFPPPVEPDPDLIVPVFKKTTDNYIPFNEIIIAMAYDDAQPIGNYHIAKNTNVYDFMKIFTKSILRQEELAKQLNKK